MSRAATILSAVAAFALASTLAIASPGPPEPRPRPSAAAEAAVPEEWLTVAERTDFRATASYEETLDFLRLLEAELPALRLEFFGTSGEGRPTPVAGLSPWEAVTPERAETRGWPVVMVQRGIHAGEIDGKDASLMLLRDMALGRRAVPQAVVLWVPIYNVVTGGFSTGRKPVDHPWLAEIFAEQAGTCRYCWRRPP